MRLKKILIVIFGVGIAAYVFTPSKLKSDDLGKASKYYDKYDYHYAIEIYERLMKKGGSLEVVEKLANCYRFIGNSIEAEKNYAKALTYPNFNVKNYLYYADALKQNSKFDKAKHYYLMYGERVPSEADMALRQANACDVARMWMEDPDRNIEIYNESEFNTQQSEFSPVIYQDGIILASDRLFSSAKPNTKENKIYGWTGNGYIKIYNAQQDKSKPNDVLKLSPFPEEINKDYHNGPASITYDGRFLAFTKGGVNKSQRNKQKSGVIHKAVYFSSFENGVWTKPEPFAYNKIAGYSLQHPALSQDGSIMYFASDMPGGYGGMDIYYSAKIDGKWTAPINCGNKINTDQDEVFPYLRSDGKLYFSSRGHITIGGLDIFSAEGQKNNWSEPENLKSPINSPKDDFGITFFQDSQSGYLSSNRMGGKGLDDIYSFAPKLSDNKFILQVAGKVVEKGTEKPIEGLKVFLYNKTTGEEKIMFSREDGSFIFDLEKDYDYSLKGDLNKFFSRQEGEISTKGVKESTIYNVKFEVERAEEAYIVRLNNIYYDFDKYVIRQDAEPELQKVVNFMNKIKDVSVEMQAHTDSRGKSSYNMQLSVQRANAAKDYLIKQGVEQERLSAKGFGETRLLNKCEDGIACSEEEHQLNRRTEFKIIKINPVSANMPSPTIKF